MGKWGLDWKNPKPRIKLEKACEYRAEINQIRNQIEEIGSLLSIDGQNAQIKN